MGQYANLNDILLFMAVADGGSFVAGGRAMGLTGSAASKGVGRLEDRLATRLFHRNSRSLSLTVEGQVFYEQGLRVLDAVAQAESSVGGAGGEPRGTLRVTVPDAFGRMVLLPLLQDYLTRWPEVRVDLNFSDRPLELIQEGFDLAFRIGAGSAGDGLISRVVAHYSVLLCAAPTYLAGRAAPQGPEGLRSHECLVFRSGNQTQAWHFREAGGPWERLPVGGRVRMDSGAALRSAALAGLGIALLPEFLVQDALQTGKLCQVLPDLDLGHAQIVALYPSKRYLEPSVRRFVDLVASALGDVGDVRSDKASGPGQSR